MNNQSDSFSNLRSSQYYQLNINLEAMLLMEIENVTSAKITANSKASEQTIIFGLGMISIMLLVSGLQLQRSVNIIPNRAKAVQTEQKFAITSNTYPKIFSQSSYNRSEFRDRVIGISIQNSISKGKF